MSSVRASSCSTRQRRRSNDEASGVCFDGFINTPQLKGIRYKGTFGNVYTFDCAASSTNTFGLTHGQRVVQRKGVDKGSFSTVLGVHLGTIWIHRDGEKCAQCCRHCFNAEELSTMYGFEPLPLDFNVHAVHPGPLGTPYFFNIAPEALERFGFRPGDVLKSGTHGDREAEVLGEFLGVLWVKWLDDPRFAAPLTGRYTHAEIQEEFEFETLTNKKDVEEDVTVYDPESVSTFELMSSPSNFFTTVSFVSLDEERNEVTYKKANGLEIVFDISRQACDPFGFYHGEELLCTKGTRAGRLCSVIGVRLGTLWIHPEGEKGAVSCVYCTNKEDLLQRHGFQLIGESQEDTTPKERSPKSPSEGSVLSRFSSARWKTSPVRPVEVVTKHFVHLGLFGDVMTFDRSREACSKFGYSHGDIIRAQRGLDSGKEFTVVGVSMGSLWVLPEGKQKCTLLPHCPNADALLQAYDFKLLGTTTLVEVTTPIVRSPRHPPPINIITPVPTPIPTMLVPSNAAAKSSAPQTPFLGEDASCSAPTPSMVEVERTRPTPRTSNASREVRLPITPLSNGAPPAGEQLAPERASSPPFVAKPYDISEELWEDGQMPHTRYFLRAYAAHNLPHEPHQKTSFHMYYMNDTCNRILYALEDLARFRRWWNGQRRENALGCGLGPFLHASWQEMLSAMKRAPRSTFLHIENDNAKVLKD